MSHPKHNTEEIARGGEELYERSIRERVEPEHVGRFLALDVFSGDHEVGDVALPNGDILVVGSTDVSSSVRSFASLEDVTFRVVQW